MSERPITEFGRDPMRPIPNAEDPVPELAEARSALAAAEARADRAEKLATDTARDWSRDLRRLEAAEQALREAEREAEQAGPATIKESRANRRLAEAAEQALREIAEAAREVDAFLSAKGPPFRFDGKQISHEAQAALLSLHDYLNSLPEPAPGDDKKRVDRDHFTSTVEGAEAYARLHPDFGGPSGDR